MAGDVLAECLATVTASGDRGGDGLRPRCSHGVAGTFLDGDLGGRPSSSTDSEDPAFDSGPVSIAVFAVGATVYVAAYSLFAIGPTAWPALLAAFLLAGLGIGFAETTESAVVAQQLPDGLRANGSVSSASPRSPVSPNVGATS